MKRGGRIEKKKVRSRSQVGSRIDRSVILVLWDGIMRRVTRGFNEKTKIIKMIVEEIVRFHLGIT